MHLRTEQIKKILRMAEIEFGGIHKVNGWNKFFAVYRIDNIKITFNVKSLNPRKNTLETKLITELQKRFQLIQLAINESFSGYISEIYTQDPYRILNLVEKYLINNYVDIDKKVI